MMSLLIPPEELFLTENEKSPETTTSSSSSVSSYAGLRVSRKPSGISSLPFVITKYAGYQLAVFYIIRTFYYVAKMRINYITIIVT